MKKLKKTILFLGFLIWIIVMLGLPLMCAILGESKCGTPEEWRIALLMGAG